MSEDKIARGIAPVVRIGKTPAGGIAVETPRTVRPQMTTTWGAMYEMLGDPTVRYGRLVQGSRVSMATRVKMLDDPVIALSVAYIGSKLVKAEYEIRCADPTIRAFFQAMYGHLHREFMLQAAMATALGCSGLIKRFRFDVPRPLAPDAPPVWTGSTIPLICDGFDQVEPVGAYPDFDEDGVFTGFHYTEGAVDRIYALWLTIGRAKAFGKYSGAGRLANAYKAWWLGEFNYDQLVVHVQKFVDRAIEVSHPPGKDENGNDLSDVAQSIGNDVRSGATVAMPSEVYTEQDDAGMDRLTSVRKWSLRMLESGENIGAFLGLSDHCDSRKAMGMFIPLQLYQQVQQSSLGGPTTSDVLGKLAVDLIIEDATDIDMHLNEYVFPFLVDVNFGSDAARVEKVTTGLNEYDRGELFALLQILAQRMDGEAADLIDQGGLIHTLGVPVREAPAREGDNVDDQRIDDQEVADQGVQDTGDEIAQRAAAHLASTVDPRLVRSMKTALAAGYDPAKNPPREVLEKILSQPLPDDADEASVITEADIARAMRILEEIPELDELETVEVGATEETAR